MTENYQFDTQQFYDLLLEGTRISFQTARWQYRNEHIYYYVLCLAADFSTIEPGVSTEEELKRYIYRFRDACKARGKQTSFEDLEKLLRYETPRLDYRIAASTNTALLAANELLADFGEYYVKGVVNDCAMLREGDNSVLSIETPYDSIVDDILETARSVLRNLDNEKLFGSGEVRDKIVLDLCWFEGGSPDALPYATGMLDTPPMPLNPPTTQQHYYNTLAEGFVIGQTLFNR